MRPREANAVREKCHPPRRLCVADSLHFNVGPRCYTAQVSPAPLMHPELGDELFGYALAGANTSKIVMVEGAPDRLQLLGHELFHAWLWLVGEMPRREEDWCDLVGCMAANLVRNLEAQGGTAALDALPPVPVEK